ncbi:MULTISPECIES: DUF6276 family protein [Halostella]|uniref:DUF6276 family protein n=1 Tax=Halostella TaxID=1843185 RepID=UPI001081DCF8|nr:MULTISPECIES: DUF6276 family protein [Halostella]
MDCPDCGAPAVSFAVPPDLRECVPESATAAALCTGCLRLHPAEDPDSDPDFGSVSDGFPQGNAAVPMALLVGLLSSLALYSEEIATLVGRVEAAGTDPLLVLDRLAAAPDIDPAVDIERRRRQLEQTL